MSDDFRGDAEATVRLADRGWRIRHSLWMLAPILSIGFLTWLGFVYIGVRARRRAWWIAGAVYGVLVIVALAAPVETSADGTTANVVGGWLLIGVWVVGIVHSCLVRRSWLRWRASGRRPAPSVAAPAHTPPQLTGTDAANQRFYDANVAPMALVAQQAPVAVVDVNTATAAQLATLPGLDPERVAVVLGARYRKGGYAGFDDFAATAQLAPQVAAYLRPWATFSQPAARP